MDDLYFKILNIKYNRLIEDPFPEHSYYENTQNYLNQTNNLLDKLFSFIKTKTLKPKKISIYQAYKLGYDKAYQDILDNIHKLKE